MYRPPRQFLHSGGAPGASQPTPPPFPQFPPQNPNFYQKNPNIYVQNPSFPSPPNPYLQNPNFSHQQFPNIRFQPHHVSPKPAEILEKIERAVSKAHRELLASGESVSAWKISENVLLYLQVDSWSSLGFQFQDVPSLYRLIVTEGKVNSFIHCFVGVRRITSLYDLDVEICKNEGVERFEELGLGPLVRHPLVQHYFLVPSDITEVFKIKCEEIISCLADYMDTCSDKDIRAEEFLSFLAKKQSVAVREKLGVRIQSLGMHIASIREARRAESAAFKKYLQSLKQTFDQRIRKEEKGLSLQRNHAQQQILDGRFNSISERVKSFSSLCENLSGKHIRFSSSSSEDESGDDNDNEDDDANDKEENRSRGQHRSASQNKKNSDQRNSNCPYPSQTEEMARLGLKVELDAHKLGCDEGNSFSGKKRKHEHQIGNLSSYQQFPKKGKVELDHLSIKDNRDKKVLKNSKEKKQNLQTQHATAGSKSNGHESLPGDGDSLEQGGGLVLPSKTMEEFITTWKEACREHTVVEVFDRMLQFYKATARHRRKMHSIFSLYPGVGLLNVAVTSIKCGMWDSLYDTFQAFGEHEVISPCGALPTEMIDIGPSCKTNAISNNNEPIRELVYSVTVDDIIKKVAVYFEISQAMDGERKLPLEKQIVSFKKFHECEIWLAKQFSVKDFGSLGYGNFFEFLEKHVTLLPQEMRRSLIGDLSEKPALVVSMLQHQLLVLLSQAASDDGLITKQHISLLLKKQFPMATFQITGNDPEGELLDLIRKQKCSDPSCRVLFSAALSRTCFIGMQSENHAPEIARLMTEVDPGAGSFGSVSGKDAIECLLKAPMLSDLLSWSHWELIYAPSLGPLIEWLLSEGHIKDLSCMVTREGKVIRIDHMATVDEFLEASLQGSAFETAVKLLSLLALYGGENHAPLFLLKCHARRAIEVIVENSMSIVQVNKSTEPFTEGKASRGQVKLDTGSDSGSIPVGTVDTIVAKDNKFCETFSRMDKAVAVASRFILDCLGHLPSEFRSFGADVLLSGLRSFSKDAPLVILRECTHIGERLMLHEIGLSLGILEWVEDYQAFSCATALDLFVRSGSQSDPSKAVDPAFSMDLNLNPDASQSLFSTDGKSMVNNKAGNDHDEAFSKTCERKLQNEVSTEKFENEHCPPSAVDNQHQDAILIIDSIRREEFGLDSHLKHAENILLKKQHARLGRALHCLSQELYSQDSHFLLELVQNADDNVYPENVDATLVFILQAEGIVILNNEQGFSAQNIRALCDVGNSTKKGSSAGYIGQKGIGFKSVFRVTDAPEIHSNGFHVKFDISEGEIGFVLPTVVSPCDINLFRRYLSCEVDQTDTTCWNTCIVLPFKSKITEGTGVSSIISMFSDLHPSLLLFLHRLQCIKFKNMLNDSLIIMRKEIMGDGIIKVSHGKEKMSWLVASQKLEARSLRPDVQTTEIAIAFTLEESSNGDYKAHLDQQPVFAFLPLRTYGLKFILQGDFVLPSSREEVDGDSAWNQWLLSEFPSLFVSAERSFASLPCFRESPGKAVTAFMSFVPLVGEVYGFFSHIPRMIISKLRLSNCMLLEGPDMGWVPPCRVLRGWDEQTHVLLPERLLHQHLGLGYLNKDIILPDPLAKTLGVQDYGPKILTEMVASICHTTDGIKAMGLDWLSSWLSALYTTLSAHSAGHLSSLNAGVEFDVIGNLREIPFIPLSDGSYGSLVEGPIWLPCDAFGIGFEGEDSPKEFPSMYAKLRTVNPLLLDAKTVNNYSMEETRTDNLIRMLHKVGVQRLSPHDVIRSHIFPAISDNDIIGRDKNLMTEYLAFVMLHLQSSCPNCHIERSEIISELRKKPVVLTNHGYKCTIEESIHFSNEFENPVTINKLIDGEDSKWHEVDSVYLKHPSTQRLSFALKNWREFFQELGVTDFVQIIHVEKNVAVVSDKSFWNITSDQDLRLTRQVVKDWESPELVHLLCTLSSRKEREKSKYLLEVLDKMWDDFFSSKVRSDFVFKSIEDSKPFQSSFIKSIRDCQWVASSMDEELHYPKDLFYDCEAVRSIVGPFAPYAVPQVRSKMCLNDIGFKTQITFDDALTILNAWRTTGTPFRASIAQMNKFYTFIWNEISTSKRKLSQEIRSVPSIFVPFPNKLRHEDLVTGKFLSPNEVYWHDPTGCVDRTKELILRDAPTNEFTSPPCKTLAHIYPSLHDFFVNECGVDETPPFASYLQILLQLSNIALPSQAADAVFQVLLKWATDIGSGFKSEDILNLKEYLLKLENAVLPSLQDKWVSLHPNFGIVCWCDDEELRKQFKHSDNIDFLHFGEISNEEKEMLSTKVSILMQRIGVPALSEVVSREAIFYGTEDCGEKASLIDWVLPYAQRYIHKLHPDIYACLKQIGLENLSQLRVVVVENLYYRNTLKGCDTVSKKRYECSCLLQGNIFYVTRASDSHSIFLELSRLFFNGCTELQLANFLHMITTMAESGSSEEQTEFFIVNSQKVPMLPEEEAIWSLPSLSPIQEDNPLQPICDPPTEKNPSKSKRNNSNWPPTSWKTAPDFRFARANHFRTQSGAPPSGSISRKESGESGGIMHMEDQMLSTEIDGDWIIQDNSATTMPLALETSNTVKNQPRLMRFSSSVNKQMNSSWPSDSVTASDLYLGFPNVAEREQLILGTPNENQTNRTGRLGELIAKKYFSEKLGPGAVKWVNEDTETGLPYDLVIGEKEGSREYVEVKSTKSSRKDWFMITTREWQFAAERGDSFSIAHVILADWKNAKITVFKNPVKLCSQNMLHLAVLMPR